VKKKRQDSCPTSGLHSLGTRTRVSSRQTTVASCSTRGATRDGWTRRPSHHSMRMVRRPTQQKPESTSDQDKALDDALSPAALFQRLVATSLTEAAASVPHELLLPASLDTPCAARLNSSRCSRSRTRGTISTRASGSAAAKEEGPADEKKGIHCAHAHIKLAVRNCRE
jgi:hypothetical protein